MNDQGVKETVQRLREAQLNRLAKLRHELEDKLNDVNAMIEKLVDEGI